MNVQIMILFQILFINLNLNDENYSETPNNWVFIHMSWNVIESKRIIESNNSSNRFEHLKCKSNSDGLQCNNNRLHVIDPIPVWNME